MCLVHRTLCDWIYSMKIFTGLATYTRINSMKARKEILVMCVMWNPLFYTYEFTFSLFYNHSQVKHGFWDPFRIWYCALWKREGVP